MLHLLCTKFYKADHLPAALIFPEQPALRKSIAVSNRDPIELFLVVFPDLLLGNQMAFCILLCENSHKFQNIFSLNTLALKALDDHKSWPSQLKVGKVTRSL